MLGGILPADLVAMGRHDRHDAAPHLVALTGMRRIMKVTPALLLCRMDASIDRLGPVAAGADCVVPLVASVGAWDVSDLCVFLSLYGRVCLVSILGDDNNYYSIPVHAAAPMLPRLLFLGLALSCCPNPAAGAVDRGLSEQSCAGTDCTWVATSGCASDDGLPAAVNKPSQAGIQHALMRCCQGTRPRLVRICACV